VKIWLSLNFDFRTTTPELQRSSAFSIHAVDFGRPRNVPQLGRATSESASQSITRDGNKLLGQATGQPSFQLFAESATKFSLRVVDAQIEFETDDTDNVTALVLVQNGKRRRAPKVK
jgi:hypothetical protein